MAEVPYFYPLDIKRLIPASELLVWLGRIVQNYAEPDGSYTPQDPTPFSTKFPISASSVVDLTSIASGSNSAHLTASLGQSASVATSQSGSGTIDFTTRKMISVRLQNHSKIFDDLRHTDEVQNDIGSMLSPGGKPAWMIVGVLIWTDATFSTVQSLQSSAAGSVTLPITATVAATTGAVVRGIDPKAEAGKVKTAFRIVEGVSLGSNIFAIQYKSVRRPPYAIGRSFTPKLGDQGPRVEGVKRYGETELDKLTPGAGRVEPIVEIEMDESSVNWIDVVDDEDENLEVVELGAISFVYSPPVTS